MKRDERYFSASARRPDGPGFSFPVRPRNDSVLTGPSNSPRGAAHFLLAVLLALVFLFASSSPSQAYYLNNVNPPNWSWVTSTPYNFQWNNNTGSGTYWGGTNAYWYYSIITIYNYSWGYVNNESWIYQPGWGTKSYSRSLTESPLGSSWWRVRGYYQYMYYYWSYELLYYYWYPVYHWVQRCGWYWKGICLYWYWSYEFWYWTYYPVYGWVYRSAYTWAYTGYTSYWYFGVDLYPPVVTQTSPANGYSACNNASVSFLFSATDSMSGINTSSAVSYLEIRKDSTGGTLITRIPINSGNNTKSYTFTSSGTYYWMVRATDNVGRTTYSSWRSLTIDVAPPTASSLSSPTGNGWLTSSTVTFSWGASSDTGTGLKGYYLKINKPDGSAYPGYGGSYGAWLGNVTSRTVYGMPETPTGNYSWWVYAEDNCANKSAVFSGDGRFRIDYSAPQITMVNPQPAPLWYNEYTASSVNIQGKFTDSVSGVMYDLIQLYRPGGAYQTGWGWYYNGTFPGTHTINTNYNCKSLGAAANGQWRATYHVYDQAWNYNWNSQYFQVDITRPSVGSISTVGGVSVTANPVANPYPIVKTATPVITWTAASDPAPQSGVANYFVKVWNSSGGLVANATLASTATSYTTPPLTTGRYYFEVSVTDRAKNGAIQNVDGISGNNQTLYTYSTSTSFPAYTSMRSFLVDLDAPEVTGYNPPLPKSGNGSYDWVVSTNPTYSGQMRDTYGVYNYQVRTYRKTGATYALLGTYSSGAPITTTSAWYTIPNITITGLTDGLYGFEIQAWDNATIAAQRSWTIAPPTYASQKYDFKVDVTPPIKGAGVQPMNNSWVVSPAHSNPKRPTFVFSAANDNQAGTNDDASFSGVKEYMIRVWWDPAFPMTYAAGEAPFFGQPYKDYYIGAATTWTIPDDLKNGGYYWDVWVKDNANNWRWYYNATTGNYTTTSVYGNTAKPAGSTYSFRVDTTEPTTNALVSYIGDLWITVFNPSFVWKAGDDPMPGSGKDYYELSLWGSAGGSPIVVTRVPCSVAPGNTAFGGNITLAYGGGTVVSGAWPPAAGGYLANGRYYWDVRLVDIAGNYKWYKSGRVNQATVYNLGESFRVDKIPPVTGGIVYPKGNQWIDQKGTRSVDENTGDFIYTPNRKPSFKFKAAQDNESGLYKYIVVLKDARSPKVVIGDQALTAATNNDLFSLAYGVEYTFNPPWGTGTWPVELKDGKYFWEVIVIDNTKVNTSYYNASGGNDNNFATFRLDTLPPTVAPNESETIRFVAPASNGDVAAGIGVGELLSPAYGYVTTVSVNLVNFKFSKAVDDINLSFNGYKLNDAAHSLYPAEGPSGIYRYNFVIASTRDKLKEFANVDLWKSDYTISTTAVTLSFYTNIPPDIDAQLNALSIGSVYWSVHVMDNAGNESQYVDRKMRIRHLPPGGGNLEAPPNGFTTTNRRPTFKWTK